MIFILFSALAMKRKAEVADLDFKPVDNSNTGLSKLQHDLQQLSELIKTFKPTPNNQKELQDLVIQFQLLKRAFSEEMESHKLNGRVHFKPTLEIKYFDPNEPVANENIVESKLPDKISRGSNATRVRPIKK
eukprot:NODE_418_length_7796_cov_0.461868.p8 type:complete len:132 gc:universal NODE_418_length_7796_cov_0.461868:6690-6295(-)